ncbi:PLP-dependent aminotransferase family protein [Paenibacillus sp. CN-4]|uniref:aminotransferase-like domain-containing protein n=1 Tax=Paenibacillus nanchangensis TaxID=3348343 RepID=UPI00397810F6
MKITYSKTAGSFGSSAVRDILKVTQGQNMISLAGGLPAEELFPAEAIRAAYDRVFSSGPSVLQYGLTEGHRPLRERIAARLETKGLSAGPDDLLLTTGSQQAIDLLCRVLLDPGDAVLVESPTYLSALQTLSAYQADIHAVDSDREGMCTDDLESKLRTLRPKLLYAVPTFSNPAGALWSEQRREAIVRLCRQYGTLILEDDPYGELAFGKGPVPPSMAAIDRRIAGGDGPAVVYVGSFSKIVAPALRTGWMTGNRELLAAAAKAKQAADLHSSTIDQCALGELMDRFDLDGHIAAVSAEYGRRMRLLSAELAARSWTGAEWQEPEGGMFLWLRLPETVRTAELLKLAVEEGVAFVPGEVFYASNPVRSAMRLNFTHTAPGRIPEAVDRLERALRRWQAGELKQTGELKQEPAASQVRQPSI